MASTERKSNTSLIDELVENGHRYGFFSAVHMLHRLRSDHVSVGELGPIAQEALRFKHSPELIFHSGDISSIEIKEGERPTLVSNFLGLYGAASPLASQFAEDVIEAEEADEFSLREFYDIFHHRLISLYYRAWKKYRLPTGFHLDGSDSATKRLLCLVGVDGHGSAAESGLPRLDVLSLAPLLAMRARPPRVLSLALRRLLPGVGITIEPFVLRKATIDASDRMRLGVACNRLNVDFTLGAQVQDRSSRFRVLIGPVEHSECEAFMPGGKRYPVLRTVIEQFTRGTLECEVDVLLKNAAGSGFRLGGKRASALGVNTRLGSGRSGHQSRMRVLVTNDPRDARTQMVEVATG